MKPKPPSTSQTDPTPPPEKEGKMDGQESDEERSPKKLKFNEAGDSAEEEEEGKAEEEADATEEGEIDSVDIEA